MPGADARGSGSIAWSRGVLSHVPTGRAGCAGSIVLPARRSLRGTTTDEIVFQLAPALSRTARWDENETSRGEAR